MVKDFCTKIFIKALAILGGREKYPVTGKQVSHDTIHSIDLLCSPYKIMFIKAM